MAETPTPAAASRLWFTSRSAAEDDFRCARKRFLQWHYGPWGVGLRKRAQSVPLATGGSVHEGLAPILRWVVQHDQLPPLAQVDAGVEAALADYDRVVSLRGLDYWETLETSAERLVTEQRLLIEGLVRIWTRWQLPEVLRTARIVHVEEEHVGVLDCTCGLGDLVGSQADHDHRGCEGIGLQSRADFVAQQRTSGLYQYHEFKTTSEAGYRWKEQWTTTMQPYIGTVGIEAALGIQVEEIYIHGLLKGKRDHEYTPATSGYDGPEYQNSRLVSAYFNTAAPEKSEWELKFEWKEPDPVTGQLRKKRLGNHFKKTSLQELFRTGASYADYIESAGEALRDLCLYTHGPLLRRDAVRTTAIESIRSRERHWRSAVWELQDLLEAHEGRLDPPAVQDALNRLAPCSFECQPFGSKYQCAMVPICHQPPGWEQPDLLGLVPRRPHHQPELDQLRARGFEPPAVDEYQEEEA